MTWAVLLGQWIEFAQSAIALPDNEQGTRLRDSVADLIVLQAIWFALEQWDVLLPGEKALGLDRAQILLERHEKALIQRWPEGLPLQIGELIDQARQAIADKNATTQ